MAGNIFDQFDTPAQSPQRGAAPAARNIFDQFDQAPQQDTGRGPLVVTVAPFRQPGVGQSPAGFGARSAREGDDTEMRQSEYLADAVRVREQQDKASPLGRIDAYVRGAAGWVPGMNKLAAAGDAAFGQGRGDTFGDRYSDNLMRQRAMDTADEALNPGSRMAGQAAGLVATAGVLPSANIVKEGVRGAAVANSALTGGLYSAGTGAIESDGGIGGKAVAAAQQGTVGTVLGVAAPFAIAGAGKVASGLGDLASTVTKPLRSAIAPEAEAARRIGQAMQRDGLTSTDDIVERLRQMQAQGAPAVLGDVGGETTRALARSAANLSPEARSALTDATTERFAGQGDRITDLLRGLGPSTAGKTLDDLQAAARLANRPAYGKAYMQGGNGLWTPELESLAQAPAVQDAIRNVVKTGANKTVIDGMPPVRNPFTTDAAGNLTLNRLPDGSIAKPNLQFWDYVQRELRGKAGEAGRAGNKDLASDYNNLRRAIVDRLDEAVPAFAEARSGAARAFQAEDALEAGQKFVTSRMANDEARVALDKMKPADRELFAEGFRSDLIAKIREAGDGRDIVKAIFGSPAARERVGIALGPTQALQLEAALQTERAMLKLQQAVGGNSNTARQIAELAMASSPSALGGAAGYYQGGSPGAVAGAVAGQALRKGRLKLDTGLAKKIGEMLASDDPRSFKRVAGMAKQSPMVMRLLDGIADEAGQLAGVSAGPLEVTVRPRGVSGYMPAAADDEQR